MRLPPLPKTLVIGPVLAVLLAGAPGVTLAATAPQTATVSITDSGFSPPDVTVGVGATVTWTDTGNNVHSATDPGGTFNSGGLSNGQNFGFQFNLPGTFSYSSAPDCQNGNSNPSFSCSASITVVAAGAPVPAPGAPAPAGLASSPAPQAPATLVSTSAQPSGTVNISDTTFSPTNVTIFVGGTVTWIEKGTGVHSATTPTGGPTAFDTGGLGPNETKSINFATAGTFVYSSGPDCLSGASNNPNFACSTGYLVTVVPQGTTSVSGSAPVAAPVAAPAPATAAPSAAAAPASNKSITMNEQNGFSPNPLTVPVGSTVTWTDQGSLVHSVVQDGGGFDSGGLSTGQQYSFTFSQPGTFTYHSSTDPVYSTDANGNQIQSWQYTGTVIVQ